MTYLEKGKETIKGILEQKMNNFADFWSYFAALRIMSRVSLIMKICLMEWFILRYPPSKNSGDKSHGEREMVITKSKRDHVLLRL